MWHPGPDSVAVCSVLTPHHLNIKCTPPQHLHAHTLTYLHIPPSTHTHLHPPPPPWHTITILQVLCNAFFPIWLIYGGLLHRKYWQKINDNPTSYFYTSGWEVTGWIAVDYHSVDRGEGIDQRQSAGLVTERSLEFLSELTLILVSVPPPCYCSSR